MTSGEIYYRSTPSAKKRDQSLATVRDSQHLYAQQQHIVAHLDR